MHSSSSQRASKILLDLLAAPTSRHVQRRTWASRTFSSATRPTSKVQLCRAQAHYRQIFTTGYRLQEANPGSAASIKAADATAPRESATDLPIRTLTDGLSDPPLAVDDEGKQVDWTRSFYGLSDTPFSPEQAEILQAPIDKDDIEIKPDGILYLPEIKYRRILNRAFGPGGWGLAPRGETIVTSKLVTREYGLVCHGRLVSIARGEQQYFDPDGIPTATEGCKSNALMRCCKDLGVASDLWDPRFIKRFMAENIQELVVEHAVTKKRRKHFMRKDDEVKFPWKVIPTPGATGTSASRPTTTSSSAKR